MKTAIVAGARTPFVRSGTDFANLTAIDLGKYAVRDALARSGLQGAEVDQLIYGTVVHDTKEAILTLNWVVNEVKKRHRIFAKVGVRSIVGFNSRTQKKSPREDDIEIPEKLSYIVVVIDEFADMMMIVGKKVEELIARIAQKARAAGIHLILATQRPSVDVITGLIKANIPTRIAFQVSSRADSRTVLDQMGAEQLLGHGDMLFLPPGTGFPVRVHGSLVSDQEVHRVAEQLRLSGAPEYLESVLEVTAGNGFSGGELDADSGEEDELYDQALAFITETGRASISSVQRQLRVGYNRAARMIEAMEASGVVGPLENGKREVFALPSPQE